MQAKQMYGRGGAAFARRERRVGKKDIGCTGKVRNDIAKAMLHMGNRRAIPHLQGRRSGSEECDPFLQRSTEHQ